MARVEISGNVGATHWMNGFWALVTGVPLFSDISTLATDFYGAFETNLLPRMGTDSHQLLSKVEYFTGTGSILAETNADHAGGQTGTAEISSAAIVIAWQIEEIYRGGKPRTYLGAQSEAKRDTNHTWQDSHVSDTASAAADFLEAVNGFTTTNVTSVSLGCLHFFRAGVALTPPTFSPFLGASCQKRICTQRRRLGPEL